ncbi:MAG: hypothetical protein JO296_13475 [Pseudonocardiales bacterium]|nr:hypothetical protein [Pseudonocardiales bacterium]
MARDEQTKDGHICRLEPLPTLRHDHHGAGHRLSRPHAPPELAFAQRLGTLVVIAHRISSAMPQNGFWSWAAATRGIG